MSCVQSFCYGCANNVDLICNVRKASTKNCDRRTKISYRRKQKVRPLINEESVVDRATRQQSNHPRAVSRACAFPESASTLYFPSIFRPSEAPIPLSVFSCILCKQVSAYSFTGITVFAHNTVY